jgi:signal transduction histidine kinase/ligand-binding sensor domain-containing protein
LKRIFLLPLIVFSSYYSSSQTLIPRFESLGVNDGLAHSSVYSIHQDRKGFMWFGTPNGLCRYDGTTLQLFQFTGSGAKGYAYSFVRGKILEDKSGNIWYSNEGGIYKWDALTETVKWVWQPDKKEFNNSEFRALYLDEESVLWMMNVVKGIIKYDIISNKITQYCFPEKVDFAHLNYSFAGADNNGNIWMKVGNDAAPLLFFDTRLQVFSIPAFIKTPDAVFFGNDKKMLVYKNELALNGDVKNVNFATPGFTVSTKKYFKLKEGIKDKYGRWWMTTLGNGLVCYDEKTHRFTEYHHNNLRLKSLPFDITTCVYIDRNDNLWIGTDGGGVARLDLKQPKFNLFPLSEGDHPVLKNYFTKCFFEDEKNRIWFGTYSNGLNIYDPFTQKLISYQNEPGKKYSLPGNIVGAIFQDKDKNKWIGSNEGISLFNEEKSLFIPVILKNLSAPYPDKGSLIYKITQAKNGDILCATTYGLVKISKSKDGNFSGGLVSENFLRSNTTDVIEMPDGHIYLARPTLGILKIKANGEGYDSLDNFLPGIDFRSISKDEKNADYLWIASGTGLFHFNVLSHTYKLYNETDGLANNYVYGVLQDSLGNLWLSTNKGLSFLNKNANTFENYSHVNGLQSNEFNTQAFYKSASGTFYFGGIKGFNWFKPDYDIREKLKPLAAITSIEINNSKFIKDSNYIFNGTISVPYDRNYFNFQFAALDFTMPGANKVQYFLEGWDAGIITTTNKSAWYANLPPGKYIFRLRVSNAEGAWSDEKKVHIIINAPFWRTKSFLLSVAFLFLFSIIYATYLLSRQKVKRKMHLLEKQIAVNAERLRISTDMHDEIGSGITRIALLSELILIKQKGKGELKSEINTISTSAHRLVQTMSEIIWALNPQNDTLENLLAYIREQSQQYFDPFDNQFDIHFPEEVPLIKLTNEERRNLYLVTKELLNNALKHAEASIISLSFFVNKNQLCFSVKDNGIGIGQKNVRAGTNGIRNLKKRMSDIGGTIEWRGIQQGTEVNYGLPLKSNTTFSTFHGTM